MIREIIDKFDSGDLMLMAIMGTMLLFGMLLLILMVISGANETQQILAACQQVADSAVDLKKCVESLK